MNKFKKLCNFTCLNCKDDCCRWYAPFLSEYDKNRIIKFVKKNNLFKGNYFNTKNKLCPYYNKKIKQCLIHPVSPLDCRIYPYSFWFERGKVELWLDLKCRATKKLVSNKKFYKEALSYAKKELINWSEGEIFGYLISDFNIEKFQKQLKRIGKRKNNF